MCENSWTRMGDNLYIHNYSLIALSEFCHLLAPITDRNCSEAVSFSSSLIPCCGTLRSPDCQREGAIFANQRGPWSPDCLTVGAKAQVHGPPDNMVPSHFYNNLLKLKGNPALYVIWI
jgi:hypothetical protein